MMMLKTTVTTPVFFWAKTTLATLLLCSASLATTAYAAPASKDDKVEFKGSLPVTQEEIAAVDVLGEICPKILGNNRNFAAGYERLLKELLPNVQQPVLALKALADDPEYQSKLKQAREDANRASVQDNREICQDIVQYQTGTKKTKK